MPTILGMIVAERLKALTNKPKVGDLIPTEAVPKLCVMFYALILLCG
jgi:hypothetical protein